MPRKNFLGRRRRLAGARPQKVALFCAFTALTTGCQHFVSVNNLGPTPVFSWPQDAVVSGLTVRPVAEKCDFEGPHSDGSRIWWHISGEIKSPVTYGVVPKGAQENAPALPFAKNCRKWIVTVTDQSLRSESTIFRH